MTSNTPSMSPEAQVQATPPPLSSSNGPGRRPWLEPAVVVAVIGLAVTILGLLLSIVFGIYGMNARIDALETDLSTRIDVLSNRMDILGADLNACVDTLSARIDVLSNLMDTLGSDLSTRIDKVYQLLLPKET